MIALGIDLATAGARVHAIDVETGASLAEVRGALPAPTERAGVRVQDPRYAEVVSELLDQLAARLGPDAARVCALATTGTSGTVVPVDAAGRAVGAAVMYDDRSTAAAERALAAGRSRPVGMLARIAAVLRQAPGAAPASTVDVVLAALAGHAVPMDTSHALKAGIDPERRLWDLAAAEAAGIDPALLPALVAPQTRVGTVATGPFAGAALVSGMTDGCTSQLATGAAGVGDTVGVLGTTLVLKAGADREVSDAARGVYSHLSPAGVWLPGGASNVGAAALAVWLPGVDPADAGLIARAEAAGPASVAVYPLPGTGERFPRADPEARFTVVGGAWDALDEAQAYRALLEGVALVERWGLDELAAAGVPSRRHVLSGGASVNPLWAAIRASALGRPVHVALTRDSGLGAAAIAAAHLTGETVTAVTARTARLGPAIDPDPRWTAPLADRYAALRAAVA